MQKFINIMVVLLVAAVLYLGIIVDFKRAQTMEALGVSDVELQGHKRVIDEDYRRLTIKFDGRGKHIQTMQNSIVQLNERVRTVVDSLGNKIDETNFFLKQVEEQLRADIRSIEGDISGINDDLSTYKRRTNRSILDIQEVVRRLEDDLKALDAQVNPKKGEE
ncbi:MAG: hypothetical protein IIB42_06240 [Candidatus Marinimicrobia bacterium]|nr:hypothetical protein [Candidatus Neomarinimicrobiota bacterium]